MRVLLIGASGAIGTRLVPQLRQRGHGVTGSSRSPGEAGRLRALGAEPIVLDVLDAMRARSGWIRPPQDYSLSIQPADHAGGSVHNAQICTPEPATPGGWDRRQIGGSWPFLELTLGDFSRSLFLTCRTPLRRGWEVNHPASPYCGDPAAARRSCHL